jgi:glycosidase
MNLLGTHDTQRILTVLGEIGNDVSDIPNSELVHRTLTPEQRERAIKLQRIAATVQYTVYGVPSVFYGDEAGLEGYDDPFCRKTFPWGRECAELLEFYRTLGKIRQENRVFADGEFCIDRCEGSVIVYTRYNDEQTITVAVNVSDFPVAYELNDKRDLLSGKEYGGILPPNSAQILA